MYLNDIPTIPQSTLAALHAARLRTVSNVLSLTPAALLQLTSLSPSALRSLFSLLHSATAARALPARSCSVATNPLTTGSVGFDAALGGGLHASKITQLVGPSGSGKTQVAFSLAASALKVGGVIWLDSSSTHAVFSRISDILTAQNVPKTEIPVLLQRLIVLPTSTVESGLACLRALRKDIVLQRNVSKLGDIVTFAEGKSVVEILARPSLLVFDSVANVLAPVLGLRDGAWSGHVALNQFCVELRWFACHAGSSVLATNRTVRDGGHMKPALGKIWTALVDVTVGLKPVFELEGRVSGWDTSTESAIIEVHISSKRSGRKHCRLQLSMDGLKDVEARMTA